MKDIDIKLTPITETNRAAALTLRVAKGQENFIETVAECLREADEWPGWRPVLIEADGAPVGFAMYGLFPSQARKAQAWMDRLLIDARHQGKGYGAAALRALLRQIAREYQCDEIYLSIFEDNAFAIGLYQRAGFRFNGEFDTKGERVMVLEKSARPEFFT